jgi:hypothetical protein
MIHVYSFYIIKKGIRSDSFFDYRIILFELIALIQQIPSFQLHPLRWHN